MAQGAIERCVWRGRRVRAGCLAAAWLLGATPAASQPLNVDFGTSWGNPSSAYGAASGQAGSWNEADLGATALVDVSGAATGASVTVSATENGNATHSGGDDALLLADNFYGFNSSWSANLSGLVPGGYLVYLYAPTNTSVPTGEMTVGGHPVSSLTGSADSELVHGTSWVAVAADAGSGSLAIAGGGAGPFEGLAGLQLVPHLPLPANVLYRETLAGETSYPTTPEIDVLSGGGLIGHPGLALDGTASHVSIDGDDPINFMGHSLSSPAPGPSVLGLRGRFEDFVHTGPTGFGQALLVVDDPDDPAQGIFVAVTLFGDQTGFAHLLSVATDPSTGTQVELTDAVAAAIVAGDVFTVEVVVDLPGDATQACVRVVAVGVQCTPVLSPALGGTVPGLFFAGGQLGVGSASDTLELDMTRFTIRGDVGPPVPTAGSLGRAALAALLLLLGARTRSARRPVRSP